MAILSVVMAFTATAQEILIAAGSSSGTYQKFLKEMSLATSKSGLTFKEVDSHGAIENLDRLVNNEVQAAFMHSDVIFFRSQAEDLSKFKTLLALFREDVHFLALTTSKRMSGGRFGTSYGAAPIVINSVADLTGCKVGAAGGGFVTTQVIRIQSGINYEVIQFGTGDEVMAALNAGTIDAAVYVGAAPLPNLKDLGAKFKLLPVPSLIVDKMKSVYRPSSVTYTKMSPYAVTTISAQALLVTKVYRSPTMISQMDTFRKTFFEKLDELKETPGNHPKWQQVEATSRGVWPWMDLPSDSPLPITKDDK